ncbi:MULTISPECIES: F0F1 ATP synthase subunit delta [Larsenimonas]|uniref:ATP synthase subunit delta n=1 Tax=Larsenimonas suaedae TaxID=1851019 RepID=A0ABU1GSJ6_9GAMM|nr:MULTISPECIES: F0F1 ATP synthase subunit delta [Larsenimonas]MCM2972726.1 F0F1 ATP synthase subunit delta [Larsenimonas suaedae]MCM5704706.1 F0F1 ATP synthase subunit delta [Larsenimonas salina]MDR5894477.1 F0F1 ATP synthase subunit delta [Larsenimonas suaedae]
MADTSQLARPYAKAAFDLARESASLDQWSAMLTTVASVTLEDKIHEILHDPRKSREEKAELLIDVCGNDLEERARNFIHVLAQQGRLALLPEIAELFEHERAEYEQRIDVVIISAYPLDDEQKNTLASALKKRLNREISITTQVDKSLLGGVVIHAGDTVIDGSVRGRLAKLASTLNI